MNLYTKWKSQKWSISSETSCIRVRSFQFFSWHPVLCISIVGYGKNNFDHDKTGEFSHEYTLSVIHRCILRQFV